MPLGVVRAAEAGGDKSCLTKRFSENFALLIDALCIGEECKGCYAQRLTERRLRAAECDGDSIDPRRSGAHQTHYDDLVQLKSKQIAGRGPKVWEPAAEQTETFGSVNFARGE